MSSDQVDIASQGVIEARIVHVEPVASNGKAGSVSAYLGIPFAQPPVGELRWRKPQGPAPSWRPEVRKSAWHRDPSQDLKLKRAIWKDRSDDGLKGHLGSEDCLYLDVWVPKDRKGPLPVMAWVYGGAFVQGSASQPLFDGARLANETGSIVVNLSYRLGLLGWGASRSLAAQHPGEGTGNYGMWDVIAGLEWIQDNIAAFAGNKDNVCAFGESAGSILLHYLILSTRTPKNLFSRAILQSGTALTVLPRTLASQQATFDAVAVKLGASPTSSDADKLAVMRKASPDDLITAASSLPSRRPRTEYSVNEAKGRPRDRRQADAKTMELEPMSLFGPTWDGVLVQPSFLEELRAGGLPPAAQLNNAQQGIILGYCVDEGTMFNFMVQTPHALHDHVTGYHPALLADVRRLYATEQVQASGRAFDTCAAYTGDALFQAPVRALMASLASSQGGGGGVPAYGYCFAHVPSARLSRGQNNAVGKEVYRSLGVLHTAEIPYVFGNDGSQAYIFARDAYGVPGDFRPETDPDDYEEEDEGDAGFTEAERVLSADLMRRWGDFASGRQQPWRRLEAVDKLEDLAILQIGSVAQRGAGSAAARNALASDADAGTREILVVETTLGQTLDWTEALYDHAVTAEKQAFWSGNGFANVLLHYYGDANQPFEK